MSTTRQTRFRAAWLTLFFVLATVEISFGDDGKAPPRSNVGVNAPVSSTLGTDPKTPIPERSAASADKSRASVVASFVPSLDPQNVQRTIETVAFFALVSLAPAAVLMVTAFVRVNIVLTILRQALGSPQVPGNQVLGALALLLTALIMQPIGEKVYQEGIKPYSSGKLDAAKAWSAGAKPIKVFMIDQIFATHHQAYLVDLYDYVEPPSTGRTPPADCEELPLRVIAPAFLLSELTTALVMGFGIYIPFLVIDLVVSAVLAAMGLFMLPPAQVALPLKLIVFVLAGGWWLVSDMLLRSFALRGG